MTVGESDEWRAYKAHGLRTLGYPGFAEHLRFSADWIEAEGRRIAHPLDAKCEQTVSRGTSHAVMRQGIG